VGGFGGELGEEVHGQTAHGDCLRGGSPYPSGGQFGGRW
jgi:hypothetical protein